ncbi:hypothetical protein KAI87_14430, partial [Myxococcota bacterium]|nr:hypothetical protein [Myxococcota bacterium]
VGSDLLISGKVRYTDGQFLIFLSLINVKTVKTLKRIEIKAEGKVGGLPGLAQTAAEQLFDLEHSAEMEADGLKIVTPEEVEEQRLAAQKNHTRVFWASAALAVVAGAGGAFMMKGAFDEYDESERIYSQYQAATDPILISDLRQQASATNESAQSKRVTAWALLGLSGAAAIGSVVARLTSPVSPELDVVPGEVGFLFCPDGTSLSAPAMWNMSW